MSNEPNASAASQTKSRAMIDNEQAVDVEELATRLFVEQVSRSHVKRGADQIYLRCYRQAEQAIAMRERIREGDVSTAKPEGPQLSGCSAPNLKKTHPHNLVSQRFGDLKTVNRIAKWLKDNPTAEVYPELEWDAPTTNLAREILPAYVTN